MKRFILFLIRLRLGLKKDELFMFSNQAHVNDRYYFTKDEVMKRTTRRDIYGNPKTMHVRSNVSLNWLLDDGCKIIKKEV